MDRIQTDKLCSELTAAIEAFRKLHQRHDAVDTRRTDDPNDDVVPSAQSNLCTILMHLHVMLAKPKCFIQHMATQTQILACLRWLSDHQVIACIPLSGSVCIDELADLADVPKATLRRVVRMTATAGFLFEPEPDHIAHTSLSARFSADLSCSDAVMFLSENVAPLTPFSKSLVKTHEGLSRPPGYWRSNGTEPLTPYLDPVAPANTEGTQPDRQWRAFSGILANEPEDVLESLFKQMNWQSLGEATIVLVHGTPLHSLEPHLQRLLPPSIRLILESPTATPLPARSTRTTFSSSSPLSSHNFHHRSDLNLHSRNHFFQQFPDSTSDPYQNSKPPPAAAAYIHVLESSSSVKQLTSILYHARLPYLRSNPSALLVIAVTQPFVLPSPGSLPLDVEIKARLQAFARTQLVGRGVFKAGGEESEQRGGEMHPDNGNEARFETGMEVEELVELIEEVRDDHLGGGGGLKMVEKVTSSRTGMIIGLVFRYRESGRGKG